MCARCAFADAANHPHSGDDKPLVLHDIPIPRTGEKLRYVGDYEILELIAHGGMGIVYRARQRSLKRIVAVKMLLNGLHARDDFKLRFLREAEAAAKLDHSNIVRIIEVGEHEGFPYFSMEYVSGETLAQKVSDRPLPPQTAAQYVQAIASAVHYAHQKGVLHRDIKPSNVLIGPDDRPRLTDFGLASCLDDDSGITMAGQILGTPAYMPPEQVAAQGTAIGPWSDVYSLGALFYHLLTGRPPFTGKTVAETLQQVRYADPVSPVALNAGVPLDLATICLKSLEKAPDRRYESAEHLALELSRWLRHEPILARPATWWERLLKWRQRNPIVSALSLALLLTVLAVLFSVTLGVVATQRQRSKAAVLIRAEEIQRQKTQAVSAHLESTQAESSFTLGDTSVALAQLARAMRQNSTNRVAAERLLSALTHRRFLFPATAPVPLSSRPLRSRTLAKIHPLANPATLRPKIALSSNSFTAIGLDGIASYWSGVGAAFHKIYTQNPALGSVIDISGDGNLALTARTNGLALYSIPESNLVYSTPETPPGLQRAFLAGSSRQVLLVDPDFLEWRGGDPSPIRLPWGGWSTDPELITTSSNGAHLLQIAEGSAKVWNAKTGNLLLETSRQTHAYRRGLFSMDGDRLLLWDREAATLVTGLETGDPRLSDLPIGAAISCGGLSPDGQMLAIGLENDTIRLWSAPDLKPLGVFQSKALPTAVCFDPTGETLMVVTKTGALLAWRVVSGLPAHEPRLHQGFARVVAADHETTTICLDSDQRLHFLRPLGSIGNLTLPAHRGPVIRTVGPVGNRLVTITEAGVIHLWDIRQIQIEATMQSPSGPIRRARISADGRHLLVEDSTRTTLLDLEARSTVTSFRSPAVDDFGDIKEDDQVFSLRLQRSEDESRLPNVAWIRNRVTGAEIGPLKGNRSYLDFPLPLRQGSREPLRPRVPLSESIRSASFANASHWVLTASQDGAVQIWETDTGRLLHALIGSSHPAKTVALSPDNRWLVKVGLGEGYETIEGWNIESGESFGAQPSTPVRAWTTNTTRADVLREGLDYSHFYSHHPIVQLSFSDDAKVALFGDSEGHLKSYSLAEGRFVSMQSLGASPVVSAVATAGGTVVAGMTASGSFGIVSSGPSAVVHSLGTTGRAGVGIRLSADGGNLMTLSPEGILRVWESNTTAPVTKEFLDSGGPDNSRFRIVIQGNSAGFEDGRSAQRLGARIQESHTIVSAALDATCTRLLVVTTANQIRLWDVHSGVPLSESIPLPESPVFTSLTSNGEGEVASVVLRDGSVCLYSFAVLSETIPNWLPDLAEGIAGVKIEDDGSVELALSNPYSWWKHFLQTGASNSVATRYLQPLFAPDLINGR